MSVGGRMLGHHIQDSLSKFQLQGFFLSAERRLSYVVPVFGFILFPLCSVSHPFSLDFKVCHYYEPILFSHCFAPLRSHLNSARSDCGAPCGPRLCGWTAWTVLQASVCVTSSSLLLLLQLHMLCQ